MIWTMLPEEKAAVVALDMLVYDEMQIWNQYENVVLLSDPESGVEAELMNHSFKNSKI